MGVPVSNCSALAYYPSPRLAGHNIAPKLRQNRFKYSSTGADPNLAEFWHVSHRSGSAAGRVGDRPLQPVVRRPCALGAVGRHAWPFSDAANSTHSYPRARKSTPSNSGSPPAEQDRRDSNVQFINEALTKILLDCVRPTADPHVHFGSGLACTVERLANASCYEVERCIAFHLDGGRA
jgi:hypothetical protein